MKRIVYSFILICIFVSVINAWITPVNISETSASSQRADLEIDAYGNLHVVWHEDMGAGKFEILYSNSSNGGATWSTLVNVSENSGSSQNPDLEIYPDGSFHLVWEDRTYGNQWEILYSNSTDNGATWSTVVNVSNNSGASQNPDLEFSTFVVPADPSVIWQDDNSGQREIYYSTSSSSGSSWITPVNISKTSGNSLNSDLEIAMSEVFHVVWSDYTYGSQWDIFYSNSSDNGATWSTGVNISNNSWVSTKPDLEISLSGNLYLVWEDNTSDFDIYYRNSSDSGGTWSTIVNVSDTGSQDNSLQADLKIDSNGILHLVWDDDTPGDTDIYYTNSSDNGATWVTPVNISINSGGSQWADLELSSTGYPYVVWHDNTAGNNEILVSNNVPISLGRVAVVTDELDFPSVMILFILSFFCFMIIKRVV